MSSGVPSILNVEFHGQDASGLLLAHCRCHPEWLLPSLGHGWHSQTLGIPSAKFLSDQWEAEASLSLPVAPQPRDAHLFSEQTGRASDPLLPSLAANLEKPFSLGFFFCPSLLRGHVLHCTWCSQVFRVLLLCSRELPYCPGDVGR